MAGLSAQTMRERLQRVRDSFVDRESPQVDFDNAWLTSGPVMEHQEAIQSLKEIPRPQAPSRTEVSAWLERPNPTSLAGFARESLPLPEPASPAPADIDDFHMSSVPKNFPKPPTWPDDINHETIKEFWDDQWKDAKGNHWQVKVNATEPFDWGGWCEGEVLCNQEKVGKFKRTFDCTPGDTEIKHDFLELDARARGNGFASTWLGRCAERYEAWNLDNIHIETGMDGAATWPKLGFDFAADKGPDYATSTYANQMRELLSTMKENSATYARSGRLSMYGTRQIQEMLDQMIQDPAGPTSFPELAKSQPDLCKVLLKGEPLELKGNTASLLEMRQKQIERATRPALSGSFDLPAHDEPSKEQNHSFDL